MKGYLWIRALVALLAVGIVFSGCADLLGPGEEEKEEEGKSDEDQIKEVFNNIKVAMENKDIDTLMSYFSDSYLDDGDTKADMRSEIEDRLGSADTVEVTVTNLNIQVSGNTATVTFNVTIVVDGITVVDDEEAEWIMRKEDGSWKFYGNQQSGEGE